MQVIHFWQRLFSAGQQREDNGTRLFGTKLCQNGTVADESEDKIIICMSKQDRLTGKLGTLSTRHIAMWADAI